MKTIKYILLTLSLIVFGTIKGQSAFDFPQYEWQSTSVFISAGSSLPMAAKEGVQFAGKQENDSYTPPPSMRKVNKDGDIGDPGAIDEPVGDGLAVLLIFAGIFLCYKLNVQKRIKQ